MKHTLSLCAIALTGALLCSTASADQRVVSVTITNITPGQTFTPLLVATHRGGQHWFELGQSASFELEALAEGGDIGPLGSQLAADEDVIDLTDSGALLPPGASTTLTLDAHRADSLSLAAMLVPTNDTFVALNALALPRRGSAVYMAYAYDAGTEHNDERCASIPGGGGCSGEGLSAASGEGFVHIGNGIHGIGDLSAAQYDWNNPVARIEIHIEH